MPFFCLPACWSQACGRAQWVSSKPQLLWHSIIIIILLGVVLKISISNQHPNHHNDHLHAEVRLVVGHDEDPKQGVGCRELKGDEEGCLRTIIWTRVTDNCILNVCFLVLSNHLNNTCPLVYPKCQCECRLKFLCFISQSSYLPPGPSNPTRPFRGWEVNWSANDSIAQQTQWPVVEVPVSKTINSLELSNLTRKEAHIFMDLMIEPTLKEV